MGIQGIVQNGVVVLDQANSFPEGTLVTVTAFAETVAQGGKRRVEFPLVKIGAAGMLDITNASLKFSKRKRLKA